MRTWNKKFRNRNGNESRKIKTDRHNSENKNYRKLNNQK